MRTTIIYSLLALFLIGGVLVTQAYVVGFEYHRYFAPSWFFIVVAFLLCLLKPMGQGKSYLFLWGGFLALSIYLGARGLLSDVPLMTGKDYPVFYYGLLSMAGMIALARQRKLFFALLIIFSIVHIYQLLIALAPLELKNSLPRPWGELASGKSGQGFFRHHNPFASYCAITMAGLAGLLFVKTRNPKFNTLLKLVCITIAIFTALAAVKSGSRLGTTSMALAGFVCLLFGFAMRFLFVSGSLKSKSLLGVVVIAALVGIVLSGGLVVKVFGEMSDQRGASGDLDSDLMGGMRLSSIGLGYDLWLDKPILGNGPRTYWYRVPELRRAPLGGVDRYSDPEMVHNDYVQTLAEYGVVGFALIIGTMLLLLYCIWKLAYRQRFINENWTVPPIIVTSAVLGIMLHSLADFTPHNTAVFVPLCLIFGAAFGYLFTTEENAGFTKKGHGKPVRLVTLITLIISSSVFIAVGKNQIIHNIELVKYDYAKWNKSESEYIQQADRIAKLAPEPILLEELGIALLNQIPKTTSTTEKMLLLAEAEERLEAGYAMHPYRITLATNLALAKLNLGKIEESGELITEAFKLSNNRWSIYNLDRLAVKFLMLKGEKLWLKERKASEAMAYFLEAEKYIASRGFRQRGMREIRKHYMGKIKEYMSVLEAGKVTPATEILFFDGYGL